MKQEILWMFRHIFNSLSPKVYLKQMYRDIASWRWFWSCYVKYGRLAPPNERPELDCLIPCLKDNTGQTFVEPIYFYQDAWAFEKIVKCSPSHHIDVGSHHKFVALLSKVLPVTMIDIRPLSLPLNSLGFKKGSILDLPIEDKSAESVSSLCVVEHIGLGRYGDPLDPKGTQKAIAELKRIVKPEGNLYLSVPIDDENRIFFNAHRAFAEDYLESLFQPFQISERRYIYGNQFKEKIQKGFGVGLYHLQNHIS